MVLLLYSLMTMQGHAMLGVVRHGACHAKAGRRCRLLKPATSRVVQLPRTQKALERRPGPCRRSSGAAANSISCASGFVSQDQATVPRKAYPRY